MNRPTWADDSLQMDQHSDMSFNMGFADNTPADGCIMCSQCLSVCTTYQQTTDMDFSPMGRIRVIRELSDQDQLASKYQLDQLESCLQCRQCESACPSCV